MTTMAEIAGLLKDAMYLSSVPWSAVADRVGGKWGLITSRGLNKAAQMGLFELLNESSVDAWLCGSLVGGSMRSVSLPERTELKTTRLFAYPIRDSRRVILVGANRLTQKDQRIWKLTASSMPADPQIGNDELNLPGLLTGLPYDLNGSLNKILMAFIRAAPSQSAWFGIRRGDALEVLAEWNDPKVKGMSFPIDGSEVLRRVNRTLAEISVSQGEPAWAEIPSWGKRRGASVWAMMPLVIGQRQIGAVAMWRDAAVSRDEWQNLRSLATHVAASVEIAATFSEMSTHLGRLGMLNDFALAISSAQNLDQIARRVIDLLARAFGTELVAILLLAIDGRTMRDFQSRDKRVFSRTISVKGHPLAPLLRRPHIVRADGNPGAGLPFFNKDARSALIVPLKSHGQVIGILRIEDTKPDAFDQHDEQLMVVIASHLAGLVENGRLREEAEGRARSLGLIHEVVQQVIGLTDKQEMAQITADLLSEYFGYEVAAVLLRDNRQKMVAQGFGGKQGGVVRRFATGYDLDALGKGIPGYVFSTGESVLVNDTSEDNRYCALGSWSASSEICVPLKENERVFGIINIESSQANAFSGNDLIAIESLAGILSVVVSGADQYRHLQGTVRQLRQAQNELKARMEAQQAAENRLLQAAKLAAVGEMAAGIAHELNNPLTTVTGFTELILDDLPEETEYRDELLMIQREAKRATEVVRRLLDFSRQGERTRTRADLNEIVEDVMALTQHLIHTSGVRLTATLGGDLPWVSVDRNQMKQVLLNLIHNALQAMPDGGDLFLSTDLRFRDGRSWVIMAIKDTGAGIAKENHDRVFEPFFTTRGERGGTGLGLSVTYQIIADHGGTINVESELGAGSIFTVWLPI